MCKKNPSYEISVRNHKQNTETLDKPMSGQEDKIKMHPKSKWRVQYYQKLGTDFSMTNTDV
jgi:hypothetical protein